MAKKMSKNLQKVQDQLDGNYKNKIQVGMHTPENVHQGRKVGDKWTDSDGVEWEQKQGYRSKVSKLAAKGLGDTCSVEDCKKLIIKPWDKDSYRWNKRCYYCQIDYEAQFERNLSTKQEGSKYGNYLEDRFEDFKKGYIEKWEAENADFLKEMKEGNSKIFDKSVANALANNNIDTTNINLKKNSK